MHFANVIGQMTTWNFLPPRSSKSFILCFYMETVRAKKQVKVYFTYFVQRDQHGVIAKHLTQRKVQF